MAAPQSGGQADNSAGILWGVAALFAAIAAIWWIFKNQIVIAYLTMKLYELRAIDFVTSHINYSIPYLDSLHMAILAAIADPASIEFSQLELLGSSVGTWMRIPFLIILLLLAVVVYIGNTTRMFKRTYNMRDFAKLERVNWAQISPVVNLDLLKTDIDTGPWSMALTPLQFCKRYRLLEEIRPQRREGVIRKDRDRVDVVLKRGEANKLFALQLGPLWKGSDKIPPYARALFAAFAARINADSKAAEKIFLQLNNSCMSKLNFSGVTEVLRKHENTKPVQSIVQSHAYVLTVMAAMLEGARDDGVQASSDFLWLKPLDRRLWYTLNTVGRQTPFIEVGGIFAHWVAEKKAGRKLLVPMVEEATNAVELALKDVVYRPDEAS
ncbi:MAG: type IVB secretion system coupling complex protein DotM/IcmP [Gammaproteobacteria bacterium]|nr:type IVB secretion system coupling complex protein DotM/IcmP [Gammaproteobacteria bacterium]